MINLENNFHYCPVCGSATGSKFFFGEERPYCPSCGYVHFFEPRVAAAEVVKQDGKVLLARRVNDPMAGHWALPAGFVNAHEDPALAAARECLEETGLEVRITGILDVFAGREHERGADIVILYSAEVTGGSLKAGDDADQVGFFDRSNLPPIAFEATRRALGIRE